MDDSLLPVSSRFEPEWLEIFIVLGAIFLVSLCMFFWVAYLRKPKKRRRIYREHHQRPGERPEEHPEPDAPDARETAGKRRRRHRRERRSLNPTLSETGGLPPRRETEDRNPPDAA